MPVTGSDMIDYTEEQWNNAFDHADAEVQKAIADLPEPVKSKTKEWECFLEKYSPRSEGQNRVLGICAMNSNAICIYVGEILEWCGYSGEKPEDVVRRVYYHELAHGLGKLYEWEVKARGL